MDELERELRGGASSICLILSQSDRLRPRDREKVRAALEAAMNELVDAYVARMRIMSEENLRLRAELAAIPEGRQHPK